MKTVLGFVAVILWFDYRHLGAKLARWVTRATIRLQPKEHQERYREEFARELQEASEKEATGLPWAAWNLAAASLRLAGVRGAASWRNATMNQVFLGTSVPAGTVALSLPFGPIFGVLFGGAMAVGSRWGAKRQRMRLRQRSAGKRFLAACGLGCAAEIAAAVLATVAVAVMPWPVSNDVWLVLIAVPCGVANGYAFGAVYAMEPYGDDGLPGVRAT